MRGSWAQAAWERDQLILRALAETDWFNEKVNPRIESGEGCWIWSGALGTGGYGLCALPITIARSSTGGAVAVRVHRVLYLREHGEIPFGMSLDHLCDVTPCCKPEHLEAVTQQVNTIRYHLTTYTGEVELADDWLDDVAARILKEANG